jgi:hypothetical protein
MCCPAIETGWPAIQSFSFVKMFFYKRKREVGGNNLVWPETESEQTGQAGTGLSWAGPESGFGKHSATCGIGCGNRWYLLPHWTGWTGRSTGMSSLAWQTWSGGV